MNIAGVDGCKGGWIMTTFINGQYKIQVYASFEKLAEENPNLDRILIDIPIGLSSISHPRTIESKLRKELGIRSSTVFNAPCRKAVYELNDKKARQFNIETEGKSLSIQSLSIRNKIRELDAYLIQNKTGNPEIIESHPELCFKYLNEGSVLLSKKSTKEGIEQRLNIIGRFRPELLEIYELGLKNFKRKTVKKDDLIDSICLCLVNELSFSKPLYLKDKNLKDAEGISMKIALP